jgi:hypothetical protein
VAVSPRAASPPEAVPRNIVARPVASEMARLQTGCAQRAQWQHSSITDHDPFSARTRRFAEARPSESRGWLLGRRGSEDSGSIGDRARKR